MSGTPSLTILSEEQKFNRDNLLQWNTNIKQLLGAKGLLGYIDGTIQKPGSGSTSPTATPDAPVISISTPIYLRNPNNEEWIFQDHLTRGHITLNCTDVASLGVVTMGMAKEAWDLIQTWGKSTNIDAPMLRRLSIRPCMLREQRSRTMLSYSRLKRLWLTI